MVKKQEQGAVILMVPMPSKEIRTRMIQEGIVFLDRNVRVLQQVRIRLPESWSCQTHHTNSDAGSIYDPEGREQYRYHPGDGGNAKPMFEPCRTIAYYNMPTQVNEAREFEDSNLGLHPPASVGEHIGVHPRTPTDGGVISAYRQPRGFEIVKKDQKGRIVPRTPSGSPSQTFLEDGFSDFDVRSID